MLDYINNFKGRMVLVYENLRVELSNDRKEVTVKTETKETSHKIKYILDENSKMNLVQCVVYKDKIGLPTYGVVYTPEYDSFKTNAPSIESKVLSDLSSMLTIMGVR